jgi:hypothetical protein
MKQRNGVLGLDTAKTVMIAFLTLAVLGVSILLAMSSLSSGVIDTIDSRTSSLSVTNETGAYINSTGYTLDAINSSTSNYALVSAFNATDNSSIGLGNITLSDAGVITNATATTWDDVLVSYTYDYSYSLGRVDSITGNVSEGLVTFFSSTGTIFSILIVVVIILAISIIIWAVGRFGQQSEGSVTL